MTAYTSLIYRNQRDYMTASTHIFLMTHYHSKIASALLAGCTWLYLGTICMQPIRLLSWVKTLFGALKTVTFGYSREKENCKWPVASFCGLWLLFTSCFNCTDTFSWLGFLLVFVLAD